MYNSIEEIQEANERLGHHFFSKDTMRFFSSRIGTTIYGGCLFVTSEQNKSIINGKRQPRGYTVRIAREDGSLNTVSDFNKLTRSQAISLAKLLASDPIALRLRFERISA